MTPETKPKKDNFLNMSLLAGIIIIAVAWIYQTGAKNTPAAIETAAATLAEKILPTKGVVIPVKWGNLGKQLVEKGVIDKEKFEAIYANRGGLSAEMEDLLYGENNSELKITEENSGFILNLLWALGLGNKNDVLEKGPMMTYSGAGSPTEALAKAGNFASTGGWTISKGDAMNHYSKHELIKLTPEQQKIVERVSQNIYRPCCGNSTYFPDCNHGMAMLALIELMASANISEDDMYRYALGVNSYWFPDTYLTIGKFLESKKIAWESADPKELLGMGFSSAQGFQQILREVTPSNQPRGAGCGV